LWIFLGLLLWGLPLRTAISGESDLRASALRLIEDRYLYPEALSSERLLDASLSHLKGQIEWLMGRVDGNVVILERGDGEEIGRFAVGGFGDLPEALGEMERLIRSSGLPVPDDLSSEVLRGAVRALDRHSTLLIGARLESFEERLKGTMSGIGARIMVEDQVFLIRNVFAGGPAEEGGLRTGDEVLRVDGVSTLGMDVERLTERIRGPKGTRVKLEVRRDEQTLTLDLRRDKIQIPNLEHRILASGVGYLAISHFSEQTVANLRRGLAELASSGGLERGLIIDLRGNTGGSMIQAARSADQFLKEGLLVRTVGRDGAPVSNLIRRMAADDERPEPPVPIVIMTDSKTASGSEIMAGALLLLDRAVLIGERTYGKGTVQKVYNLRSDVRLKLTVAEYLLSGDFAVAGKGIDPDVQIGRVVLDRNGMWVENDYNVGEREALLFVDERTGWAGHEDKEEAESAQIRFAERVLLEAKGTRRDDVLQALRLVESRVRAEETFRMVSAMGRNDLDWSAASVDGPAPKVEVRLETDGPVRSGEAVSFRAKVTNLGSTPLHRAQVRLVSGNATWNGIVLPIGKIASGASAEGRRVVSLRAGLAGRIDEVSFLVEADRRPPSPAVRQRVEIEPRLKPSLTVRGRLVPHKGHHRAELEVTNGGKYELHALRFRFDFPARESIELVDREGFLPALSPGETRRVDIALSVSESFGDDVLPLELQVDAERFGDLVHWDFPLPVDGSLIQYEAPEVRVKAPSAARSGEETKVSFRASDDSAVAFVVVYVNGEKSHYVTGQGRRLDYAIDFTPRVGHNRVRLYVEDDAGLRTVRTVNVYGEPSGAAVADKEQESPSE